MADIYLTNSLTRKKERFEPVAASNVGIYTCGPTVYDFQHIGNFRTMILSDILIRTLKFNGYQVRAVRNITDIDDKIIKGASAKKEPIEKFSKRFADNFFEDLEKLNILPVDVNPRATDHVGEMIAYIQTLIEKELAYVEKDGSVYFDISKFPNYGKLSKLDKDMIMTGTRVLSDEYSKENVQDFALWKATKEGETASYDSPWGKGRPGWHIECSVMSQKYLGDTLDIHLGGKDLLFPHHENEIAQSEAATGKPFVKYWVHGEMLLIDGGKMSKSLKNFYLLKDLEEKGFTPLSYRYLVLTAHYRDFLNFTWESLEGAQNALEKLKAQVSSFKEEKERTALSPEKEEKISKYRADFLAAVNDDLNTPQALAVLWEMVKSNIPSPDKYDLAVSFDEVLGLNLSKLPSNQVTKLPSEIKKLLDQRDELRKEGKFDEADKIRSKIEGLGYKIKDAPIS